MKLQIEDLGFVGIVVEDWDITREYKPRTITTDYSTWASYISRKFVPANTPLNNTEYWKQIIKFDKFQHELDVINEKIDQSELIIIHYVPDDTSEDNKLINERQLNEKVSLNDATYISNNGEPFDNLTQLNDYTGSKDNNDYAWVKGLDLNGNPTYTRYKYNQTNDVWNAEFTIYNLNLTTTQWSAVNSGITSSILSNLLTSLAGKANTADLATVATSGSYNDLEDKPTIPDAQIQSDWNQTNLSAKDFIKNKPTLFSGSYNDLADKPTVYTQQQVDNLISPKANASDLSTVATSGDYNDLSNKPSLFSGNYNDLTNKPTIPTITTDTVKVPVIEIFADRECTKHPNGVVNKVYAKFYKRFGFNEEFIAKDTTDPNDKYITVVAPTIEYPTEDYGLNWCVDFVDGNVPSTPYEFGDIIELQTCANEDLDITGLPNIFYADGTVGYITPETTTPIAPIGFAQVFADKECTKYAYGYTNKVYVRLNRNQAARENITYCSGDDATSMYVSAPESPTYSYSLNLWIDFNAEDRRTPYTAGVYECTCAFWVNINTFNKIFGA